MRNWKLWFYREPDFIIGDPPYLRRWYVIPRNRFFNIYLHNIIKSDDDRALHDHPWRSVSIMLKGELTEFYHDRKGILRSRHLTAPNIVHRSPTFAHRLNLPGYCPGAWTLFITGPVRRAWGFLCPQGWRHWKEFTAPGRKGQIGRGCE
jgi:hypothetical protein